MELGTNQKMWLKGTSYLYDDPNDDNFAIDFTRVTNKEKVSKGLLDIPSEDDLNEILPF